MLTLTEFRFPGFRRGFVVSWRLTPDSEKDDSPNSLQNYAESNGFKRDERQSDNRMENLSLASPAPVAIPTNLGGNPHSWVDDLADEEDGVSAINRTFVSKAPAPLIHLPAAAMTNPPHSTCLLPHQILCSGTPLDPGERSRPCLSMAKKIGRLAAGKRVD